MKEGHVCVFVCVIVRTIVTPVGQLHTQLWEVDSKNIENEKSYILLW